MNKLTMELDIPNPIGRALMLLVAQTIRNMSFLDGFSAALVTNDEGDRYTEMAYDDHEANLKNFNILDETDRKLIQNSHELTTVRIFEDGHVAGLCTLQFLQIKEGEIDPVVTYERKNILPFYTGATVGLITEFLLGDTIFTDLEPIPFPSVEKSNGGEGWYLKDQPVPVPASETIYPDITAARASEPEVPEFVYRLRDAAKKMHLDEVVTEADGLIAMLDNTIIYDVRGFRTIYDDHNNKIGVRFYTNLEVKAKAVEMYTQITGRMVDVRDDELQRVIKEMDEERFKRSVRPQ